MDGGGATHNDSGGGRPAGATRVAGRVRAWYDRGSLGGALSRETLFPPRRSPAFLNVPRPETLEREGYGRAEG